MHFIVLLLVLVVALRSLLYCWDCGLYNILLHVPLSSSSPAEYRITYCWRSRRAAAWWSKGAFGFPHSKCQTVVVVVVIANGTVLAKNSNYILLAATKFIFAVVSYMALLLQDNCLHIVWFLWDVIITILTDLPANNIGLFFAWIVVCAFVECWLVAGSFNCQWMNKRRVNYLPKFNARSAHLSHYYYYYYYSNWDQDDRKQCWWWLLLLR